MVVSASLTIFAVISYRLDRCAVQDVEYDGLRIPKGTIVTYPMLAMHYDAEAWPQPEKFDPDRCGLEFSIIIFSPYCTCSRKIF